jgi:protein-S-isoprenylcysteine O-methyltransferase Ste14
MTLFAAKLIWCSCVIAWFIIRLPYERRSRRLRMVRREDRMRELALLTVSSLGLFFVPMIYVVTGVPRQASYPLQPLAAWLGTAVFAAALPLFYRTHRDLGRNWSATLVIRENHSLVTRGVYRLVRHPMYSAFWMWAAAQALLLPNWVAGFAGIIGFGVLFFVRVGREEKLMVETFGDDYRRYMARTRRIIPGIY